MSFKNAYYLLPGGFIFILAVLLYIQSQRKMRKRRELFAEASMFQKVVSHDPTKRPLYKNILIIFSILCLIFTLARPQGSSYEDTVRGEGFDLIVALDVSKSMYAKDVAGMNRLEVAKIIIKSMIAGLKEDRVGLVVFAGETMIQSPLTYDKNSFLTFLDRASPALLTLQGSDLSGALTASIDRFEKDDERSKVIILLSDGEDSNSKALDAAIKEATEKDIHIITVGIGSEEGAYIPESTDWFGYVKYLKHKGKNVVTKLDETSLKKIAEAGGGDYYRAKDEDTAIAVIKALNQVERSLVENVKVLRRRELYCWPLLLAFVILAVEWLISDRPFLSAQSDRDEDRI